MNTKYELRLLHNYSYICAQRTGVAGVADAGATAVLREHRLASLASSAELLAALSSAKGKDALTEVDLEVLVRRPGRAVPADGDAIVENALRLFAVHSRR